MAKAIDPTGPADKRKESPEPQAEENSAKKPQDTTVDDSSDVVVTIDPAVFCVENCRWAEIGDSKCNKACNIEACSFDGGDCDQT
jgi:hypothetical protein